MGSRAISKRTEERGQLASAALFFPGDHPWSGAARLACGAGADKLGSPNLLKATFDKIHLQRFLYSQMLPVAYPDCLAEHLAKHIAALVDLNPAHLIGTTVLGLVTAAIPHLKKLRTHETFQVIRTWANSWCTSARFHEPTLLPCLFGCSGKPDDLLHYCFCRRLHRVVDALLPVYRPPHPP